MLSIIRVALVRRSLYRSGLDDGMALKFAPTIDGGLMGTLFRSGPAYRQ